MALVGSSGFCFAVGALRQLAYNRKPKIAERKGRQESESPERPPPEALGKVPTMEFPKKKAYRIWSL